MTELDFKAIETPLGELAGFSEGKIINIAAKIAREEIIQKTEAGVDANRIPFKPYTPRYRQIREKRGYRTDIVNLRVSGDMLDSLHLEGDTLTVQYSEKLKAQGNEERWGREFIGLDENDLDKIEQAIWNELNAESEGWISSYG